jgi:hypothetical protein
MELGTQYQKPVFPYKLTKALKNSGMLCSKDAVATDASGQTTGPETSVNQPPICNV